MAKKKKGYRLQWHPAFYAGLQIELGKDAGNLIFENEHQLSTKTLGIDVLVIKKDADIPIHKNIGRIFRKYNLVEYKSPSDYLSIDDFYKGYAYASLYKSLAEHEDEIKTSEMTITFISRRYPRKLEKYLLEKRNYHFVKSEEGIFHIAGNDFVMQLIVTSQITKEENLWLWSLCNQIKDTGTVERLVSEYGKNKTCRHYESVMDMIVRANRKQFGLEDKNMCKALEEIMEERIIAREKRAEARARTEARTEAIIELLEDYGEISGELQEKICKETDVGVLKTWHKLAAKAGSIEEFKQAM